MPTYDQMQSGVTPRVMPNASHIGGVNELMISYCDGVKCLVVHDGVTPGGCWKICANGSTSGGGTCGCDTQKIIDIINNWAETNLPKQITGWSVKPGVGSQNADDNILVVTYADGSTVELPLYDDDGVVDVAWNEGNRQLTVTFDNGNTRILTIGDKFARLSADGETIIFPDGRTWEHCCPDIYRGTCGCNYPANPVNGAYHYNGGDSGCVARYNGENWITVADIRKGDIFYCTNTGHQYTANSTCNWTDTTDSICMLPMTAASKANENLFFEVEDCSVEPCDCADDPDCDCDCVDIIEAKSKMSLSELAGRLNKCLPDPARLDGCGTREQVVMQQNDDGCWTLGILSAEAKRPKIIEANDGQLAVPFRDTAYTWPDDFGTMYSLDDLRNADAAGNGTIDEAIIANNVVVGGTVEIPCPAQFDASYFVNVIKEANVQAAYDNRTVLTYRYRVDGGPWIYTRFASNNVISIFTPFNGLNTSEAADFTRSLPAGTIDFQLLAFHDGSPVKIQIRNPDPATQQPSAPRVRFLPVAD